MNASLFLRAGVRRLVQSTSVRHQVCGLVLLLAACMPARAQFSLDWSSVDGGGGTSTGGVFTVTGTIGQPDAGLPMTNGVYSLTGGFWALPTAVQTPEAPVLSIALAGSGKATVSWSPPSPGWVLQESVSLSPPDWHDSPSGATNPVEVPATPPSRFYRLHQE